MMSTPWRLSPRYKRWKLPQGLPMLAFKLVYSDGYDLNLGAHVFPSRKYRLIHDRILSEGFATAEDFVEPLAATDDQILLVHKPEWVQKLKTGALTYMEMMRLEIPYSKQMVDG